MSTAIYRLLIAQFLSAFADNAILFTVIALVMKSSQLATWYVPALQSVFLIAFVILAPWVGSFADKHAKAHVLIVGNLIKACGAGLLLFGIEPLVAYCLVGFGAALYSPAKYGILPELADHSFLVKANSWIEGSTILAILTGMLVGAQVADYSIQWALAGSIALLTLSALVSFSLPHNPQKQHSGKSAIADFFTHIAEFTAVERSRFAILGAALFWAAAATLRVILVAWAPLVLFTTSATEIAQLTLFLAIGIIVGSALVPRMIPLEHLHRVRFPAYTMALLIITLSLANDIWFARFILLGIGCAGGMLIVPINSALQEIGQQTIGSGRAVAIQGFFQNISMLLAVGIYTYAAANNVDPILAMLSLGFITFTSTFLISLRIPNTAK